MAMNKVYFHIGNPKAFSTSFQSLLSKNHNKSVFYIGFFSNTDVTKWYAHPLVARLFNFDLRITSRKIFNENLSAYRDFFRRVISTAQLPIVLSNENISMRFLIGELETEEKLRRLDDIFRDIAQLEVILFFRGIGNSIRSIYKEYIKQGYTEDFDYFQDESIFLDGSNYLEALFPDTTANILSNFPHIESNAVYLRKTESTQRIFSACKSFFPNFIEFQFESLNQLDDSYIFGTLLPQNRGSGFKDSLGLFENHRLLWHVDNFNELRWRKLRHRRAIRDLSSPNERQSHAPVEFNPKFLVFLQRKWGETKNRLIYKSYNQAIGLADEIFDFT
jgi:hypothetical protein